MMIPNAVNWNCIFSGVDDTKNNTVYLTIMVALILSVLLVVQIRLQNKKHMEEVRHH